MSNCIIARAPRQRSLLSPRSALEEIVGRYDANGDGRQTATDAQWLKMEPTSERSPYTLTLHAFYTAPSILDRPLLAMQPDHGIICHGLPSVVNHDIYRQPPYLPTAMASLPGPMLFHLQDTSSIGAFRPMPADTTSLTLGVPRAPCDEVLSSALFPGPCVLLEHVDEKRYGRVYDHEWATASFDYEDTLSSFTTVLDDAHYDPRQSWDRQHSLAASESSAGGDTFSDIDHSPLDCTFTEPTPSETAEIFVAPRDLTKPDVSSSPEEMHNCEEVARRWSVSSVASSALTSFAEACHTDAVSHEDSRTALKDLLVAGREHGLSYKEIAHIHGLKEPDSTLRGIYRSAVKTSAHRKRTPPWKEQDVALLKRAVNTLRVDKKKSRVSKKNTTARSLRRPVVWSKVSAWMKVNGASYPFAGFSCARKWGELGGDDE